MWSFLQGFTVALLSFMYTQIFPRRCQALSILCHHMAEGCGQSTGRTAQCRFGNEVEDGGL